MSRFISMTHRQRQYLRLGICLLVLSICVFVFSVLAQRARYQKEAVANIENLGGSVMYDFEIQGRAEPPGPRWLRAMIGDDFFRRVEVVMFWKAETDDNSLRNLKFMTKVKKLFLDGTEVTDAGLSHLEHLESLQFLSLRQTAITEDAVKRIRNKLPECWIR